MAYGETPIQLSVPEQPSASQWTAAQYIQAVKDAVNQRLDDLGINPVRDRWLNRYDVPDTTAAAPGYVEQLLSATLVDTSKYNFVLANHNETKKMVIYRLVGSQLICTTVVVAEPNSPLDPNDFEVDVPIDQGLSVKVMLYFEVNSLAPFPAASPT